MQIVMDDQLTYFSVIDYFVLVGLLCISVAVGIYYGCFGTKQKTAEDYLHGGKKMKAFPIALSLTSSHLSGITLLGIPAEVYLSGTQYMACPLTIALLFATITWIFLPVYYKLQLFSSFEYLKLRFGQNTRRLASCLYILSSLLYVPIVIYVPSLALNQVTGISIYAISPLICVVCIFYTTLGGLKAVVISDSIQFSITVFTMFTIFSVGTYLCGGFAKIWETTKNSNRIEFFNMSIDPTVRQTFWTIVVGMGVTFIGNMGVSPSSVQRFLSLPTYGDARRSVVIFCIGTIMTKLVSCFIGLIMLTKYENCDPLSNKNINRMDQLLPLYVMDTFGKFKGFPGLFVASVLCTALSTMSTSINTLSLTIFEDLMKPLLPKDISQNAVNIIIKSIVVISGTISLLLIFLIEKLGGVLQIGLSFHGLTLGPLVGLTLLGMIFPCANNKGALSGGICSLVLTGILVGGAQYYTLQGKIKVSHKPLSVAGCDSLSKILSNNSTSFSEVISEEPPRIFLISFYYYSVVGMTVVLLVGLLVSWLTKREDDAPVDRDLLSPCIYRFLPENVKQETDLVLYESLEKALTKVQKEEEQVV